MNIKNIRLRAYICSALAAAAVSESVIAEEKSSTLEEIVVTAQRRSESLQSVPLAISAFSDEKRDLVGIQTVQDMANFAPGLSYNTATDRPSIRGIARQSNFFSLDSPIAIYVDGVYTATSQDAERRPIFIERTEILRGPQGALSGRGSIGGAINTISKQPGNEFGGEARIYGATYERYGAEATVTTPITDWFRARLNVGRYRQDKGYFNNVANGKTEGNHSNNRDIQDLLLSFNLGKSVELFIKGSYVNYEEKARAGFTTAPYVATSLVSPSPYASPSVSMVPVATWAYFSNFPYTQVGTATQNPVITTNDPRNFSSDMNATQTVNNYHNVTSQLTWHAPSVDVKWIGGQQKYSYKGVSDLDGTSVVTMTLPSPTNPALPGRVVASSGTNTYKEQREWYSNELTFTSTGSGVIDWIGGLYQSHENYDQPIASYVYPGYTELNQPFGTVNQFVANLTSLGGGGPPIIPAVAPAPNAVPGQSIYEQFNGTTVSEAVFGQMDYNLSDAWKFSVGLRYNRDKKDTTEYLRFITNAGLGAGLGPYMAGGGLGVPLSVDLTTTAAPLVAPGVPLPAGVVRDRGIDPVTGNRVRDLQDSWHATTGSVGIDFKPTTHDLIYMRVANGYRPGGFNAGSINPRPEVDKESVISYEAGYKATLFNQLQLTTAVFYYDYKDIQLPLNFFGNCINPLALSTCTAFNTFVNIPTAVSQGVEIEANWNATDNLNFILTYAYLDAHIKDGLSGTSGFLNTEDPAAILSSAHAYLPIGSVDTFTGLPSYSQDISGNRLANSPKNKVAANVNYTFRFSPGNLILSASYVWRESAFSNVFETKESKVPSYHTVGARIIWTDTENRYSIMAYGTNLTDALAYESGNTTRVRTGLSGPAGAAYYPGGDLQPPREYGLELQYRFGSK